MINQEYNTYYSQLETNSGRCNVIVTRIRTMLMSTSRWTSITCAPGLEVVERTDKEQEFSRVLQRIENLLDIIEFDWTSTDTAKLKILTKDLSNYYQDKALQCYYEDKLKEMQQNIQCANTVLFCGNMGVWLETLGNLIKSRDAILDDLTRARKKVEEDIERNENKKLIRAKLEEALKDVQCTNKESIILGALNSF